MGYDEFSTKSADYVIRYGLHMKNPIPPKEIFDNSESGVDAVAIEVRGSKVWTAGSVRKTFRKLLRGEAQREDYDVVRYCKEKNIPIYVTGTGRTKKNHVLFWASIVVMVLLIQITLPLLLILVCILFYTIPGKKRRVHRIMSFLMAIQFMFLQPMNGSIVNALCAKKMEEYVVPRLKKKLKRRPRIGLNYGLAHMGMRIDFQNKKFREFNLLALKYLNYEFWNKWGAYRSKVGKVYKANFDKKIGKWKVESHETHFFDESKTLKS